MSRVIYWNVCVVLLGSLAWSGAPIHAQSTPIGNEFQVNSYTTDRQVEPRVAADGSGNFVVVWSAIFHTFGRQVFADGSLGNEIFLELARASDVASASDGQFVIASRYDGDDAIRAQVYDATGMPQGMEIDVFVDPALEFRDLAMDMADTGTFVVVWQSDAGAQDIYGRQMMLDGTPVGEAFRVNTLIGGTQGEPAVAMADSGDFAVVWASVNSVGDDTSGVSVQGRFFASSGQALSDQFQVNSTTTGRQDQPAVTALADQSFVVAWSDSSGAFDSEGRGIVTQRLDSTGTPIGTEMLVNTYTTGEQGIPDVADLDDGGFMVTWESYGSPEGDSLRFSVQGRVYDSLGQPSGDQFQINSYAPDAQRRVKVATSSGLRSLAVWESRGSTGSDTDRESIQGQMLGPLTPEVFADGFESGNTASWADTQP